jgi:predicted GNAT family N-acyltransferase
MKFGFEKVGDEFEEAGIWHFKMVNFDDLRNILLHFLVY